MASSAVAPARERSVPIRERKAVLGNKTVEIPFCPRCGSDYTDRVRRNALERFLSLFVPFRKWSCGDCHHRFWHRPQENRKSRSITVKMVP